jgi:hypothetical protein
MGEYGPEGAPVTIVASGVRRQVAVDYSGGNVALAKTNGLSCNVAGTVVFLDAAGNAVTRYMEAGRDYPWEVTQVNNSGTTASMGIYALYSQ